MSNKSIVVIPAYEPPSSLINYVNALIEGGVSNVIIVNDGSPKKYDGVFFEAQKIEGVTLLTYSKNQGKGYALKYAFNYVKENFDSSSVVVTADCDGQHTVKDVLSLANVATNNTNALILGTRDFNNENVPRRSKFGNVNTRRMFRLVYGMNVTDTQTGLRAFSYSMLDDMLNISGTRFEYEMNVLICLFKKNVEFIETPIETVYEEKAEDVERRSHFKTFSDSFKVWSVLLRNVQTYLIASILSFIVDIGIFAIFKFFVFNSIENVYLCDGLSVVTSRIASSIFNYFLNYKYVFIGKGASTIVRYYVLWCGILSTSCLFTLIFGTLLGLDTVVIKLIVDIILALISYRIQTVWVFPHGSKHKN